MKLADQLGLTESSREYLKDGCDLPRRGRSHRVQIDYGRSRLRVGLFDPGPDPAAPARGARLARTIVVAKSEIVEVRIEFAAFGPVRALAGLLPAHAPVIRMSYRPKCGRRARRLELFLHECRFRAFKECMDFWFGPHDGSEPDCLVYSPLLKLRRDRQERSLLNPWR